MIQFKHILIRFINTIFSGFVYIKRGIFWLFKRKSDRNLEETKTFGVLFRFYKIYHFIKRKLHISYTPLKYWIFAPLSNKAIVHIMFIAFTGAVIASNVFALETRFDETSLSLKQNILYQLTSDQDFELIEEKGAARPQEFVQSYFSAEESAMFADKQSAVEKIYETQPKFIVREDAIQKPQITSTTTNLKLRNKVEDYTVASGDTLSGIAQKFGINMTTLLWANNLTVRSYIKPGDDLKILPVDGLTHKITRGDSLSRIAKKYNSNVDSIVLQNNLVDAQDIRIGQELIIPGGEKPAPVRTVKSRYTPTTKSTSVIKSTSSGYSAAKPTIAKAPAQNTRFVWPTAWRVITQYYSWRHTALDIDGHYHTPIYASEAGTVIVAQGGWNGGYGLYIIIDHGGGLTSLYAHASKIFVKKGDRVERGEVIAMVGTTGRSTGTHLHYEVRENGRRVNPLRYTK